MAKARRTTHRSSKGKKLYAVRDSEGRFKDIQTYERAHGMDLQRTSKAETATKRKKARKKTVKKKAARKTTKKR
jgi:uncharacterized protein YjhX (UPF0386 family)